MSPTVVGGTVAGMILGTAPYMSPEQAAPGKEPVPFLETDEETNAPMTAVG